MVPTLPAGMRDWLPSEARALALLARRILRSFESFGYQRVTVPAFEYAEVLERGLGALDPAEVLRFVEPQSGEVVALRPDMTPQIARLMASRLRDRPLPARVCYEGSVVRLRRQRARRKRQIPQAGVELLGASASEGDREVLEVAIAAVRAAGLTDFVLDLSHATVAGALLQVAPPEGRAGLIEALSLRDPALLTDRARGMQLDASVRGGLLALLDLAGGAEVLSRAQKQLEGTPAAKGVKSLSALADWIQSQGLATRLFVDLADVRHSAYYTGALFQILAEGPGEAVVSGGRYDRLLERFGSPSPAAGFAVDLDNLAWAVGEGGRSTRPTVVLLHGAANDRLRQVAGALRGQGVAVACHETGGDEYARSWGYSHRLDLSTPEVLHDLSRGKRHGLRVASPDDVAGQILETLGRHAPSTGDDT